MGGHHGSKRYDIIVSEPSNPWVSGVAQLFSHEFYLDVSRHLAPTGLFVQWLQLYESQFDDLASVFKALSGAFADYAVWSTTDAEILIVASAVSHLPEIDPWIFDEPELSSELLQVGLSDSIDLRARYLGDERLLRALFEASRAPANSAFHPYLAYQAARSRFLNETAVPELGDLHIAPVPVLEALQRVPRVSDRPWTLSAHFSATLRQRQALALSGRVIGKREELDERALPYAMEMSGAFLASALSDCSETTEDRALQLALHELACSVNPFVTPARADELWRAVRRKLCLPQRTRAEYWLALYRAVGVRDFPSMLHFAERLLEKGRLGPSDTRYAYVLSAGLLGAWQRSGASGARTFMSRAAPGFEVSASTPPELRLLTRLMK